MKNEVVLLSFDVEEFDLPKEHGAEISLEEGVKVSAEGLMRILDVLKKTGVKATFFTTGNFAKTRPDLVLKIRKAGHEVACHGVDHFKPAKSDANESKRIIEKIAGIKVAGYRQPRMGSINYGELRRCGYKYDSSVNPAFIPGRYNNTNVPRKLFAKKGIVEVPTSVATFARVPLFWLALHLFPLGLYINLLKMAVKKTGYFATYFHPWEFAEISRFKSVPGYIKHNSGKRLVSRLEKLILNLKKSGYEFTTYENYVSIYYNGVKKGKNKKLSRLKISLCKTWQENRFLVKPFLVLCLIYLVGISAILLAGVHYADDIARTNYGYSGWNGFSRYASTLLAYGLHADGYLTNIAPLPQILAVVILALASLILICLVAGKDKFKESPKKWWWYMVAVVPLGLSPYMLECLSYQYDAPYMAISVLMAVLPLIFRKKSKWVYGFAILVGVLAVCTTYQAAIGILPMVVIMMAIREWNEGGKKNGKQILKFVVFTAVIFVVSLVIFQKILMKPRDAYVSNSLPEIGRLFTLFFEHLRTYFELVVNDFKILWKVLLVLMVLAFVVLFAVRSKRNKLLAVVVAIAGVVLMAVFSFAFYAVLEKPLYATRAMYPFGAFIAILGVYVMSGRGWLMILKIPAVILAWCFFVFAFTYGNALKEQDVYRNYVIDMVAADLNELPLMLEEDGPMKNIQVSGSLGYSPVILHMPSDYKILQRLLMPSFSEYVPWMANRVVQGSGLYNLYYSEEEDLTEKDLPVLKETVLYNIYGDEKNILVEFKDTRKFNVTF